MKTSLNSGIIAGAAVLLFSVALQPVHLSASESPLHRIYTESTDDFPSAVCVSGRSLVHTSQIMPSEKAGAAAESQCADVLRQLTGCVQIFSSTAADVVRLNVYVRDTIVRSRFLTLVKDWPKSERPALSFVATQLPEATALVSVDAVFVSRAKNHPAQPIVDEARFDDRRIVTSCMPEGDLVYVSGQAETGDLTTATTNTLNGLLRTLQHLKLQQIHILQVKCFLKPMSDVAVVNGRISEFFGSKSVPPVSHVEWISGSRPIEIELVAWAPRREATDSVEFVTPPWMKSSPVFSRVARINGDQRIYLSSLHSAEKADGAKETQQVFEQMTKILTASGSDLRYLAKATYYVSDSEASAQLNQIRPKIYDPSRPPAASKAMVSFTGANRSLVIDMIAAPRDFSDTSRNASSK